MIKPAELIRLSVEIEHGIDANGDLIPKLGKDSALLLVSYHRDGYVIHFRHDIPDEIRRQALSLGSEAMLTDHDKIKTILGQCVVCEKVWFGEGYYFAVVLRRCLILSRGIGMERPNAPRMRFLF